MPPTISPKTEQNKKTRKTVPVVIRNQARQLTAKETREAMEAIGLLNVQDIFRHGKTIVETEKLRIDSQLGHAENQANLQMQLNGITSNSTFSHVEVNVSVVSFTSNQKKLPAQVLQAAQYVRAALQQSMNTRITLVVSGTPD